MEIGGGRKKDSQQKKEGKITQDKSSKWKKNEESKEND
jgi:hypothetical protein